jgi:hypothetical protein
VLPNVTSDARLNVANVIDVNAVESVKVEPLYEPVDAVIS